MLDLNILHINNFYEFISGWLFYFSIDSFKNSNQDLFNDKIFGKYSYHFTYLYIYSLLSSLGVIFPHLRLLYLISKLLIINEYIQIFNKLNTGNIFLKNIVTHVRVILLNLFLSLLFINNLYNITFFVDISSKICECIIFISFYNMTSSYNLNINSNDDFDLYRSYQIQYNNIIYYSNKVISLYILYTFAFLFLDNNYNTFNNILFSITFYYFNHIISANVYLYYITKNSDPIYNSCPPPSPM